MSAVQFPSAFSACSDQSIETRPISSETPKILYQSGTAALKATECFLPVTRPVYSDGTDKQTARNKFCDEVNMAFKQARDAGIDSPVIIGALPFDLREKPDLYIPRHCTITRGKLRSETASCVAHATPPHRLSSSSTPDHAGYKKAVSQAATLIGQNRLQKVVLARRLSVLFDTPVNIDTVFDRLVALNPTATHFQVPLASGATLLGASPELLLRREGRRVICTPLAGSARRGSTPEEDAQIGSALLVSAKDRHEHAFVVDQLHSILAPLCDSLHIPSEPCLMQTAQMWHLATHIEGQLAYPQPTALDLALRVHPTPAVCGTPTDQAHHLISSLEPFQRGPFAGAVGWCDHHGDGEWAVTIRCGLVQDREVHVYAGAGIVGDSDPEMEWAETEAKLGTMLTAFGLTRPIR